VVPLFSLGLSNHGLWSADEPRVAEIGREMALTGNWAVPTLNQRPFLEQPPLYYGALALTFKSFGISDKVARIPSAFFAFASIIVLFFVANFLSGPRVALLSGLILATTGEYFRVAHTVIVDGALTFFVICSMGLFVTGYLSDSNRKKLLCYILFYVSSSLAFFTKGFIGIVIPGLGILAFLMVDKNLKEIVRMKLWIGALIFLTMTLPWFIALWQQGGKEYLEAFLVHNHLQRFLPGSLAGSISGEASGHHRPFYYYLIEFPVGFLPWSLLLVPVFIHAFSKSGKPETPSEKGRLFAKSWFLAGIIFLSVSSTKRTLYLMPIFAPIAMMTALYIDSTLTSQSLNRIGKLFQWVFVLVLAMIGIGAIPLYVYVKGIYPWIAGTNLFASVAILSLLMMAFSLAAMWYLWRGDLKRYWVANTAPIFAGLVFAAVIIAPVVDRHKSFVPFCQEVAATVPHGQTFFAYQPDETLRGAIPFYTGHYLVEIRDLDSLRKISEIEEPFFIMARDKRRKFEGDLLSTGRLSIFHQQKMGIDRTLTVFKKKDYMTADINSIRDRINGGDYMLFDEASTSLRNYKASRIMESNTKL
jgi:4-amino-4-deoxy-L-arabinose transferase-like glycosyltransferase